MTSRTIWSAVAAAALVSPPVAAQYSRTVGDTLRYEEVTEGRVRLQPPGGTVNVRTLHDGIVALAFSGGNEATAWYERLRLEQDGPQGQRQRPSTDSILHQPFNLMVDASGRIATISTPAFPPQIASMTDLTQQFSDFFITIPEGDLPVGREWADTLRHTRAGRPEDTYRAHSIRSFRIESTTEVDGEPAVVISVSQRTEVEASSPLGEPGLRAETKLVGVEEGRAIFSPSSGLLLSRDRRARLEGEFAVTGGPTPVRFPQSYEYYSRLTLVR